MLLHFVHSLEDTKQLRKKMDGLVVYI